PPTHLLDNSRSFLGGVALSNLLVGLLVLALPRFQPLQAEPQGTVEVFQGPAHGLLQGAAGVSETVTDQMLELLDSGLQPAGHAFPEARQEPAQVEADGLADGPDRRRWVHLAGRGHGDGVGQALVNVLQRPAQALAEGLLLPDDLVPHLCVDFAEP